MPHYLLYTERKKESMNKLFDYFANNNDKKVRFDNRMYIVWIPQRKEYETFRDQLWYSAHDYKEFIRVYKLEMAVKNHKN